MFGIMLMLFCILRLSLTVYFRVVVNFTLHSIRMLTNVKIVQVSVVGIQFMR